jgi:hypothetical protein
MIDQPARFIRGHRLRYNAVAETITFSPGVVVSVIELEPDSRRSVG